MKEIIQICNKYSSFGGVEVVVKEIYEQLGGRVYASEKKVGDELDLDIIRPEKVVEVKGQYAPIDLSYYRRFLHDIKNRTPVIHLPTLLGLIALTLCLVYRRRCVVLQHARGDGFVGFMYFQISKFFYLFDNVEVIVSSKHELKFSRLTGRAKVINFYASFKPNVRQKRKRVSSRKKPALDFLFIGRLVNYKGIIPLIDNVVSLSSEYMVRLHIVGGGPLMQQVLERAEKYPDRLKVYGAISQFKKYRLLTNVDALVVSSVNKGEAFNLTQLEAISVGCPIILKELCSGSQDTAIHSRLVCRYKYRIEEALPQLLAMNEVDISNSLSFYQEKYNKSLSLKKLKEAIYK
jgi:glycosyltransferase involved in cell wall biosynthesis